MYTYMKTMTLIAGLRRAEGPCERSPMPIEIGETEENHT